MLQIPLLDSVHCNALTPRGLGKHIILKNLTHPKARRPRADCCDNIRDSLLCPTQSGRLPQLILEFLFWLSILVHPCSHFGCGFLTLCGIGLSYYSTKQALGVIREFFILLAEPTYKDIKMNDLPFGILSFFQNLELDQVLTGCKGTFKKLPSPNRHRNQNPLANLHDPSGQNTVLELRP